MFLKHFEILKVSHFDIFDIFEKTISIDKLCPQSGLKHSVVHFQGIGMKFIFFSILFFVKIFFKKLDFYP